MKMLTAIVVLLSVSLLFQMATYGAVNKLKEMVQRDENRRLAKDIFRRP